MKLIANLIKNENGALLFDIEGFTPPLETEKRYKLEIKEYKTNRSLEQNAMMWAIIQQIADETGHDIWEIYILGLKHVKAKFEWYACLPEAIENLKKGFRAVEDVEACEINGKPARACKCYIGSSKFDTAEMKKLIDYFLEEAEKLGIRVERTL